MAQIKKISVATVVGKILIETLVAHHSKNGADAALPLMRVLGQAVGTKTGTSAYGDWTALVGRFKATNLESGEVMEASQCFLPEIAMVPIQVALSNTGAGGSVTFAIDVSVRMIPAEKRKPGGVPYEYTFDPVVEPNDDDPLVALERSIQAGPRALTFAGAAPVAAPAPAPAASAPAPASRKR